MFWVEERYLSNEEFVTETASLETDVFRFLAIIGFCLLAIFALVQAMPFTGLTTENPIEDFSQKFREQQHHLKGLEMENRSLQKEIERLSQEASLEEAFKEQVESAEIEIGRQRQEIQRLMMEKEERKRDLFAYNQQIEMRDMKIRQLEDDMRRMEFRLEKEQISVEPTKAELSTQQVLKPVTSKSSPTRRLYVAFENDSVFMNLLNSQKIVLYIRVLNLEKGFRVVPRNGRMDFESGIPASELDFWEIREDVVPYEIIRAFRAWTTLGNQKKKYLVGLTQEISSQVRNKEKESGRVIIRAGGQVVFSRDGG